MSDDTEKQKDKLENLGQLIDRYAQSRSLGLLIPLVIIIINVGLLIGAGKLVSWMPAWWSLGILFLTMAWVGVGAIWFTFRLVPKHEYSFYRKDGKIELEREKIPIWAWVVYLVPFLGATVLSAEEIMPIRWALTLALVSLGVFVFYVSGKEKNRTSGVVFTVLVLMEAAVIAVGVPTPWAAKSWTYSYFVTLTVYFVGAMLITAVVVHIYNRAILRKIKETRPFGEQTANKSGT